MKKTSYNNHAKSKNTLIINKNISQNWKEQQQHLSIIFTLQNQKAFLLCGGSVKEENGSNLQNKLEY